MNTEQTSRKNDARLHLLGVTEVNMKPLLFPLLLPVFALASCTTLPRPQITPQSAGDPEAVRILRESSKQGGDSWQRLQRVEVAYDGKWSRFVERTQPILVDSGYRKRSVETYTPSLNRVLQVHRGPLGEKRVQRTPGRIKVWRNGEEASDRVELQAAALVADAYTLFTFGSSVLSKRGSGWQLAGHRTLHGERCSLVEGTLRPGLGESDADAVIAWIGTETKRLHRVQFTLNGLESTAGADVDVTFGDFEAGPYGTEWLRHFVERVRRPLDVEAHEWRMTKLKAIR